MTTSPDDPVHPVAGGITIRQHFAALAMQGLLADSSLTPHWDPEGCVRIALAHADALIAALNEETAP